MTAEQPCLARLFGFAVAGAALLLGAYPPAARGNGPPPAPVTLDGPADVRGLKIDDVDGDGVKDLLLLAGREVRGWKGVKGSLPAAAPTWVWKVPDAATFVSPGRAYGEGAAKTPSLLALGRAEAFRLLPGKPPIVEEGIPVDVPWTDARRANLSDFVRGSSIFLPTPGGFRWLSDWTADRTKGFDVPLPPIRKVTPAGPFLEDSAVVSFAWPTPTLVAKDPALGGRDSVFFVGSDGVHAFVPDGERLVDLLWSTDFLAPPPPSGERRRVIVDLDADGLPDFVQETTTNLTGEYVFFRTPKPRDPVPAGKGPVVAGDLKPARGLVRTTGFQLPRDYVDLDGDGRLDFVLTTIEIDATNVMAAVMKGKCVARTRAWLDRAKGPDDDFFSPKPDVERQSEIGIRIRYSYSGQIETGRSYTILSTADLDGDGRKDLVIRTGPDELTIWPSTKDGIWAGEPRKVAIPAIGQSPDIEGYVGDLTGDGRDDLILLYRAPPGEADRTVVLVSP